MGRFSDAVLTAGDVPVTAFAALGVVENLDVLAPGTARSPVGCQSPSTEAFLLW
jgi:hypothetical protein